MAVLGAWPMRWAPALSLGALRGGQSAVPALCAPPLCLGGSWKAHGHSCLLAWFLAVYNEKLAIRKAGAQHMRLQGPGTGANGV